MKRKWLAGCMIAALLLFGCGAPQSAADNGAAAAHSQDTAAGGGDAYQQLAAEEAGVSQPNAPADAAQERKLIRTVNLTVETKTYEAYLTHVQQQTAAFGGYVASSSVSGTSYRSDGARYASFTLRVPADQADAFLAQLGEAANVTHRQEQTEDITLTYSDVEAEREALQVEQARLLELIARAESVDSLVVLEARLTEVRTRLGEIDSRLKLYDNQVAYATVQLEIEEVISYSDVLPGAHEPGLGEQIGQTFSDSLQSLGRVGRALMLFVVAASPYLLILGVIALAVVLIVRAASRRGRRQPPEKKEP